ncbi:MAG: hypothetical protein ACI9YH_000394 [Colwellia sp.]|jgi:hypothetical protein
MKKLFIYCYENTRIGYYFYHSLKSLVDVFKFNRFTDRYYTIRKFKDVFNKDLDLKHPKTFNEKLQWLKLFDASSLKTTCADKLAVRSFVEKNIGNEYLIPLIYTTTNYENILPDKLPNYPFVIKTNHFSGKVFIIRDKSNVCFDEVRTSLKYQLRKNFYHGHRELQYKNIPPSIIVEKLLVDTDGNIPSDYKIHCFNGKPKYVQVDTARFTQHTRCMYDPDWSLLDFSLQKPKGKRTDRPAALEEMLKIAEKLSKKFLYVRVDLYEVNQKVFFGELTFTSGAGLEIFIPKSIDLLWGNQLDISVDKP